MDREAMIENTQARGSFPNTSVTFTRGRRGLGSKPGTVLDSGLVFRLRLAAIDVEVIKTESRPVFKKALSFPGLITGPKALNSCLTVSLLKCWYSSTALHIAK